MDFINRIIYNLTQVHPFHTMVVHFPIALTAAALFFILLALWRRSDLLEQVAFANISLAAVSTLVAGITGFVDNINNYGGAAPNATLKIILASTLLVVTTVTALVRWRNPGLFHTPPMQKAVYLSAYVVSFGLTGVLGFLGGVILYGF
jgi:uncharacterized membrane protein